MNTIAIFVSLIPLVLTILIYRIVERRVVADEENAGYTNPANAYLLLLIGIGGGIPFGLLFLVILFQELNKW